MYRFYQACRCPKISEENCKECEYSIIGFVRDSTTSTTLDSWFNEIIRGDRYELVEKKDWKLNNLKKELTKLQDTLKEYKDLEKYYANLAVTMEEKVNNVESEIKELEK